MKLKYHMLLGLLPIFLLSFTHTSTKVLRWEIIGHKIINHKLDKCEVTIKAADRKSVAVRIGVNGGDVDVHHCVASFEDGTSQTIPLRSKINSGNLSKIVHFKGEKKNIIKFEVYYHPDRLAKGKTVIELWAKSEMDDALAGNQ
jgi:hypothetical protein